MNKRNDVKVVIGGKQYNMGGYESEEYFHNLAAYINAKIEELKSQSGYPRLDSELRNVLLQINIADDYFKLQQSHNDIMLDYNDRQKELVELKKESIVFETRLEELEQENHTIKEENLELQKKIIRLETELRELKRVKRK